MSVEAQLRAEVARFVNRGCDIDDLYDWLCLHVQALADSPDDTARALDGLAWLMVSEWSIGDRTEDEARAILCEELREALVAP